MQLDKERVLKIIRASIKEDMPNGDITTDNVVSSDRQTKAVIVANEDCVICGMPILEWIINLIDDSLAFKPLVEDGLKVSAEMEIALIQGNARGILKAERLLLNFLSFLSGISTKTRQYVDKVCEYGTKILDTRKTLPLLRYLEKYAVYVGGGTNHRMSLSDMVLIKDNHHCIEKSKIDLNSVREKVQSNIKIEVEIETIDHFKFVIKQNPDIIMLDNMSVKEVTEAITMRNEYQKQTGHRVTLEASGSMILDTIEDYAKTGVDTISVGAITDDIQGADLSLNFLC